MDAAGPRPGARFGADRLIRTRLLGWVAPSAANHVVDHEGRALVRPGQGGVILGLGPGDPAGGWESDHLEPGASLAHPDPSANRALQTFACLGNRATVTGGAAVGAEGVVVGKHGATIVAFSPADLELLAPGDPVVVDGHGVGLAIPDEPAVAVHSCSPEVLDGLLAGSTPDGRWRVRVAAILPPEAAAAGLGMDVARFNIDLQVDQPPVAAAADGLRFGDIVALLDQDHSVGREHRAGWIAIGAIAHGHSVGGGHGLGMVTLVSGPEDRFSLEAASGASLTSLVRFPWLA